MGDLDTTWARRIEDLEFQIKTMSTEILELNTRLAKLEKKEETKNEKER